MGRLEVFSQRARAAQDARRQQADPARVDAGAQAGGSVPWLSEGLREGLARYGREHVCHHRSGHHGSEGVCGEEVGRNDFVSRECGFTLTVKIGKPLANEKAGRQMELLVQQCGRI